MNRILVVTGAGISRAAGLPTYRGTGGLYPSGAIPLRAHDARSKNLPDLWQRLMPLIDGVRQAAPTPAHLTLAGCRGVTVVTQNVDGLHEAAGTTNVVAIHGSLAHARCLHPGANHRYDVPAQDAFVAAVDVPRCPVDNSRLRPDIVLFEERLDMALLQTAQRAARDADTVLVVGSSLQVHPTAGLVTTALNAGASGVWFDVDPETALNHVAPDDYASFRRLEPVAGDVQKTLPAYVARRRLNDCQ